MFPTFSRNSNNDVKNASGLVPAKSVDSTMKSETVKKNKKSSKLGSLFYDWKFINH